MFNTCYNTVSGRKPLLADFNMFFTVVILTVQNQTIKDIKDWILRCGNSMKPKSAHGQWSHGIKFPNQQIVSRAQNLFMVIYKPLIA